MGSFEFSFKAMGTEVDIFIETSSDREPSFDHIVEDVALLEQKWSRFIDTSEISRLNQSNGELVVVSSETFKILKTAVGAIESTNGVFSPFVRTDLAGYSKPFDELGDTREASFVPGRGQLEFFDDTHSVRLQAGQIDLGGIAKGYTADYIADRHLDERTRHITVSIGGDMRLVDRDQTPRAVSVELGDESHTIQLANGAVATSSRLERRWETESGDTSHLRDPKTGGELTTENLAVAVVTDTATRAEVLTKLLLSLSPDQVESKATQLGCSGVLLTADGSTAFGDWASFIAVS